MSYDPINTVRDLATQDPSAAVQQTPTAATTPAVKGGSSGGGSDSISSMQDLKKKDPALYKLVLEGMATTMINEMRTQQEHIKELMRKAQSESEGR